MQWVLGWCRKLVEHFHKSTKDTYKLWDKQKMLQLPQHKLTQECVTRWGSTLDMLQRLMEQQEAIAAVLMEGKVRYLMPESDEWTKYPTVSPFKPLLYKLVEKTLAIGDSDSTTVIAVKKAIKSNLQGRYQSAAVQRICQPTLIHDTKSCLFLMSYRNKEW